MVPKLTRRIAAAVVTGLAVLALGPGTATPATHAQVNYCFFGRVYPHPPTGSQVTVYFRDGHVRTLRCVDQKWTTLVKPSPVATIGPVPTQPPRAP